MALGDLDGPFFTSNNILGSDDPRYFSKVAQDAESTASGQTIVCGITSKDHYSRQAFRLSLTLYNGDLFGPQYSICLFNEIRG